MALSLTPRSVWAPSFRFPSFFDEDEDMSLAVSSSSGVSISEDEKHVYVSASLPGVDPKDVEVTFDKGIVWIKGESSEEENKGKKYYRRATSSFSYRIAVPGELDMNIEPKATCKHGVMTVEFAKSAKSQPKKISVSTEK